MKDDNRRRVDRSGTKISKKQKLILSADEKLESKFGFDVFNEGEKRLGWLLTFTTAYNANVICPNKHQAEPEKFYNNRLLESETYIGGHVECLETGVFRSDLPTSFKLDPSAFKQLIENLDRDLEFAIKVEGKMDGVHSVSNYDEVKNAIMEKPPSIVTDEVCIACDFNRPGKTCLRNLEWVWRGETYTAKRSDYYHIKRQIESEFVDGPQSKLFIDLPKVDQQLKLSERLKKYCQKAYKRVLEKPITEIRKAGICMRENPFYVDTVRSFRDRRYEYKGLNKVWKGKLSEAKASGNPIKIQEAQDMVILYDSLQLAHKCILNSFYGYVMRKGARWYSMEMAGVVTYTGAKIIQNAHLLVKKIGRPLELDTDGIWCALPGSFPENFTFKTRDSKKKLTISYPCVMLNADVMVNNTNDQYQAMILPASKEEGILLKKRYAVFNEDGTLAELKGFEIKRRGELKLIKVFQAELFEKFLHGSTLEECYSVVASVANRWLDLLDNQGKDIADSELLDYISESSTMSKSLADYGQQKSCAVTTARRLADFLGDTMVKDKGLRCQYVVACEPRGNPVSERAVPVAIFETDAEIMKFYLKKWCKISSDFGIRSIIDWSYYKQRLSSAIQKIITIPAAMQKVSNPVPRVVHPDWLYKKVREKEDKIKQRKLGDFFSSVNEIKKDYLENDASGENHEANEQRVVDLEDFGRNGKSSGVGPRPIVRSYETNHKTSGQGASSKENHDICQTGDRMVSSAQPIDVDIEDIDKHLDYQGWLDSKKRKWKQVRERKKRQRLDTLGESNKRNGATDIPVGVSNKRRAQGTGVGSYFKRQEAALTGSHWQIIQFIPSSQNGQFFAWVVVDGTMHKVPINVPRVFYINYKAPVTEEFPGRLVNKNLPHGHNRHNLIEVITDEDQFRTESRKLAAHLADPEVEVDYVANPKDAEKILQRVVSDFRSQLHGPAIAVIECPDVDLMKVGIRALDDFPCVNIPSRDFKYQMLWVSDDGNPDLGGDNEEETCYFDEVNQPILICEGAYRKVTVELKIHNLAVNALLLGFDHDLTSGSHLPLDEDTQCFAAFCVLRQLIKRCVADALSNNIFADHLLQHLYRWLCSPQSKLHDPALFRMLHKVMQKMFAQLLAKFRKSGATIIFANYSKVILDTGKPDLSAAQAYCETLKETLRESNLFEWIELETTQFWHSLLFMDQYNYGGIRAINQTNDGLQVDIVAQWNIAESLPKDTRDYLILIVSKFLYLSWKVTQDQASKRENVRDDDECTLTITAPAAGEVFQLSITEHLEEEQIVPHFTRNLLKIVSKCKSHALEFIIRVCAALQLDQNVEDDIRIMKRNLLKLVHVKEFAPEAQFQKRSISFTLPNVFCSYCNECRDIDLLENSALLTQEWRCSDPQCGQPYNREKMENRLLQIARQRERSYHLQDLAYNANVICPNKHQAEPEKFYNNRLLESETYIGGHVECLETGVFRSDLPTSFKLDPSAFKQLIENLDRDLEFAIKVEGKMDGVHSVSNYDEVKNAIMEKPPSIVTDEVCIACDFNRPGKTCLRNLEWVWRGETYTAKRSDYYHIKRQIESEFVDGPQSKLFIDLPKVDQQLKLSERLKKYCQKAYKRVLEKPITEIRKAGICMRENPFYVDTVRSFRDRRYEYKGLNKVWKGKLSEAKASGNPIKIQEAQDMVILYDSLQLAHKCILNSFYGYVMRKGARWYSMEMAGVVTYTGAKIIQNAHLLVKKIGRPLELDTDGIWCALPGSFPENFTFKTRDSKKKLTISYPCVMLNADVMVNNTNDQYQAMILPASKEEGILLKKRYAVFNEDGTLAELKGFEIKRRGELKLIKVFQAELFEKFLHGSTLEECYSVVASVANRWLDLLDNQGKDIADSELLDYISESSTMSKSLADYGQQKSCAVTTARRLADFLGDTMVKDKGLRCQYVVACEPRGNPVSERAVPVAIFETDAEIMKFYLKKWCKISSDFGIRSIIDWSYYKQRLSSAIQKIITIPAAMQKVSNPVPRVVHPDWLYKKVREKEDKIKQRKLGDFFSSVNEIKKDYLENDANGENHEANEQRVVDLEDFGRNGKSSGVGPRPIVRSYETNHKTSGQGASSKENPDICQTGDRMVSSAQPIDVDIEDIDKHLDYQGWLDSKKRKWKQVRERKKRQRVFYINYKAPVTEEFPGRLVNKNLPHGHNRHNLIEVITDEDQFRTESRKLAAHLADPEVEGIYETKVGLDFNSIVQMGCVCKVDKSAKKRNAKDGWSLNELHMKTTTECSYLESSICYFFLYHSIFEVRGIYLVYFPSRSIIHAVMVNPFQNKELSPHILEKQFREACQALSIEPPMPRDAFTFKVDYVANPKDAEKILQRVVSDFRSQLHGPAIAVIECPDVDLMKAGIRALDDFPCVNIPSRDFKYQALGWQIVAAKFGMHRCATSSRWLNERISLSRYSHVPLGNIESDWSIQTADIFFARALRDREQMLWVSDDGNPDLGGDNEEETCYFDEVNQPILICEGAYRKVTVELKIHNLAVNALLLGFDHDLTSGSHLPLDEDTQCFAAFCVLRQLIKRCVADALSNNIFADHLLQHLYRWLCSPQSKLHDPALFRMLHKVMQKMFAQLLAKFRKSGATIIFANYSKVILDTGKPDLSAAQAYCETLKETLRESNLFEWIELETTQFWHSLLFMDQYNYGGIRAINQTNDGLQVDIVAQWNIAESLPKDTRDYLILIVSKFLYLSWKVTQDQASKRENVRDDDECTLTITAPAAGEVFQLSITEHLEEEQIVPHFTRNLLKIVSKCKSHALEFIIRVCAALQLDQNVEDDIRIMKRNLLKLVHVKEFAPEAQFQKRSISFTLPNVFCSYCNECRDIDLLENSALLTQEWRCSDPQCGQPYNREKMENRLLQIARQRERSYHLQDLVCLKCRQIKGAHLAEHCVCAGSFALTENPTVFKDKMQVLLNIAVNQKFELLKECVSWILELN
ncbi:hypothetical protein SSX86_003396 [Deinandra increscens subsp. villosa]|uniref:DNA-directed DNA polymerase n=2 Tax=Magnoliopsida TaxID=3398 RepID=A0AAP0DLX7_9ASTR